MRVEDLIPVAALPCHLQRFLRLRVALHIVYFHLLCSGAAWGQRASTSFGPVLDLPLEFTPYGLTVGRARNGIAVALSDDANGFHIYSPAPFPAMQRMISFRSSALLQAGAQADLDGDGYDEYFALDRGGGSVHLLKVSRSSKIEETVIPLDARASRLIVADVNNDGRVDILLFGKNSSGVQVLYGKSGRKFHPGDVLFPDISASDLAAADLNGDGITDLVILHWLSNQLVTFYGIGRGIFSEQVSVELPGEPAVLSLTPVSRQRMFSVAVTIPEKGTIVVLEGNPTGEILPLLRVRLPGDLQSVRFVHANGDARYDIVFGTMEQIGVLLSDIRGGFSEPLWLGLPGAHVAFADIDGNKKPDLLAIDVKQKRLVVIGNDVGKTSRLWPTVLCAGLSPGGLSVRDFDGNGTTDLAVVNTGSSSMSLFLNRGNGLFSGQYSITLPKQPLYVRAIGSPGDVARTLITSHTADEQLTVVRLTTNPDGHESFTLPSGLNPYVVLAKEDPGSFEILVKYSSVRDRTPSLSLFEQVKGGQFVERSLRSNLPNWIVALTVDDLTRNGKYDLICATHPGTSSMSAISVGSAEQEFDFTSLRKAFEYHDPTGDTRGIVTGTIDGDSIKDVAVFKGGMEGAIVVAYGRGDGTFRDSLDWIRNVTPLHEDALIIADVDMDGRSDFTYIDQKRSEVMVSYQRQGGGFSTPLRLTSAAGVRAIRVGQFFRPGQQDLVLSHGDRGTVSIIPDAFRR